MRANYCVQDGGEGANSEEGVGGVFDLPGRRFGCLLLSVEIQKRLLPTCFDPRRAVQIRRGDSVHQLLHLFAHQFKAERRYLDDNRSSFGPLQHSHSCAEFERRHKIARI